MTRETAREYLPLVQALAEGKLQERKVIDGVWVDAWVDCEGTNFDQPSRFYRVKPEPRRWWVVVCPHGVTIWKSRQEALNSGGCGEKDEVIEVVEVVKP